MHGYCILVAEMARARIFTLEPAEFPEMETSPRLLERRTLANPQHKASEGQIWTDTRRGAHKEHMSTGQKGEPTGIPHHNYDEHRENNERMSNRSFARDVVEDLKRVVGRTPVDHVVVCAEKQMLGYLRPELEQALPRDVQVDVITKDLANLSPHALHMKLAGDGVLPEQKRPHIPGQ